MFLKWFFTTLMVAILVVAINFVLLSNFAGALPVGPMLLSMFHDKIVFWAAGWGATLLLLFLPWVLDMFTFTHREVFSAGVGQFFLWTIIALVIMGGILLGFAFNPYFTCLFNTFVLYPMLIAAVRVAFRFDIKESWDKLLQSTMKIKTIDFRFTGEVVVESMRWREDLLQFYQGVAVSSGSIGFLVVIAWGMLSYTPIGARPWGSQALEDHFSNLNPPISPVSNATNASAGYGQAYSPTILTLFAAPMITGYGLIMYSFLAIIRVRFQRSNAEIDTMRDLLTIHVSASAQAEEEDNPDIAEKAKILMMHSERIQKISVGHHYAVCTIFGALLVLGVATKLAGLKRIVSSLHAVAFLAIGFGYIISLTSLSKILRNYVEGIKNVKLIRPSIEGLQTNISFHGLSVVLALPIIPLYAFASAVNQCCRSCRKIEDERGMKKEDKSMFTSGFAFQKAHFGSMNVTSIFYSASSWGAYFFLTTFFFSFLVNVVFIVLDSILGENFWVRLIVWFGVSLLLMQIPFVLGAHLYVAGGYLVVTPLSLLISNKLVAFIIGNVVVVICSFILKMVAVILHHQLVGHWLSKSPTMRRLMRVNHPMVRTIEMILRQPGMSLGKVAIFCSFPDWVVNVFCGMQHLPLKQVFMGSWPIVIFQVFAVTTGSLYTRKAEFDFFVPLANATIILGLFFTFGMGFMASSEIQDKYNLFYRELSVPRLDHLELDWDTFKDEGKYRAFAAMNDWPQVPFCHKFMLIFGAIGQSIATYVWLFFLPMTLTPLDFEDEFDDFVTAKSFPGFGVIGLFVISLIFSQLGNKMLNSRCAATFLQLESEAQLMRSQWEREREEKRQAEIKLIAEESANMENRYLTVIEVLEERIEKGVEESAAIRMKSTVENMIRQKEEYTFIRKTLRDPKIILSA